MLRIQAKHIPVEFTGLFSREACGYIPKSFTNVNIIRIQCDFYRIGRIRIGLLRFGQKNNASVLHVEEKWFNSMEFSAD